MTPEHAPVDVAVTQADRVAAVEERIIRAICRERCAEFGDPPCFEIAPDDWTDGKADCECHQIGPVAARAALTHGEAA